MADPILPRAQARIADGGGAPTREWFDFFRSLLAFVQTQEGDNSDVEAQIQAIIARLEAIENESAPVLQGLVSVEVIGSLESGLARVQLLNDQDAPGNTYYYGTGPTGEKGWFAVADALSQGDGIQLTTGLDGVTEIAHGDTSSVPDVSASFSGAVVLSNFSQTYDEFGHVLSTTISGDLLDHNQLNDIQGGIPSERYHFTEAEHTGLLLWAGEDPADYALITQSITNGDTTHSPSGDAVFDALSALSGVYQPLDTTLTALAGQNWAANALPIGSGADTVAQVAFAANTFPARASTGNLAAKAITDQALTLLGSTSTTNLPEGTNLYFTDERAQDAVGGTVDGTGDVPLSYNDTTGAISAALSSGVQASLALADTAVQPDDFSGALVTLSGDQSIPDSTGTMLSFGAEAYDQGGYFDAGVPTRLTVPADGIYVASASAVFASNATGYRRLQLFLNGAAFSGRPLSLQPAVSGIATGINCDSAPIYCSAGDYFEAQVTQTSGGALNVSQNNATWFAIRRLATT